MMRMMMRRMMMIMIVIKFDMLELLGKYFLILFPLKDRIRKPQIRRKNRPKKCDFWLKKNCFFLHFLSKNREGGGTPQNL